MKFAEYMMNNYTIYKSLYIFDFDDTLVYTPHPVEGKKNYYKETGEVWPYVGWWNNPYSLRPPVVPIPAPISMLNQEVFLKVSEGNTDPNTYVVILTGRKTNMRKDIKRILKDYNIKVNELILTQPKVDTLAFKKKTIIHLIDKLPNLERVEMWDDRGAKFAKRTENPTDNHISAFKKLGQRVEQVKEFENPNLNFVFKVHEVS